MALIELSASSPELGMAMVAQAACGALPAALAGDAVVACERFILDHVEDAETIRQRPLIRLGHVHERRNDLHGPFKRKA